MVYFLTVCMRSMVEDESCCLLGFTFYSYTFGYCTDISYNIRRALTNLI